MNETAKSRRSFSKRMTGWNMAAAWALIFVAFYFDQVALVLPQALGFIGVLVTIYTGIGHLDYRKILESTSAAIGGDAK